MTKNYFQVEDRLERPPKHAEPVCSSIEDTVKQIGRALETSWNPESRELLLLLRSRHLRTLLETHDACVAARTSYSVPAPPSTNGHAKEEEEEEISTEQRYNSLDRAKRKPLLKKMPSTDAQLEAVRIVGLRRQPDEPLVGILERYD